MFDAPTLAFLKSHLPMLPMLVAEQSLASDIDALVEMALPGARPAVVFDHNTGEALGNRVLRALKGAVRIELEGAAIADIATAERVRRTATSCDALVAVGSGTINDICKYAAFTDKKPYVIFATAASMNGYLSANASLSENGFKKTLPMRMPLACFCDLSVIAAAPARLNKSGLGDSLARPTAQADWLLSHLLLGTEYNEVPFALLKPLEPELFERARGIATGDKESITLLLKTLLLSGLGMTITKGSYPASQGEHMIAHAMGMKLVASRQSPVASTLHGEEIGITTLTMAALQEQLLRGRPALRDVHFLQDEIHQMFGDKAAEEAEKAYGEKRQRIKKSELDSRLRGNDELWESVAERINQITLPPAKIAGILKAAQAPNSPEALGWKLADYQAVQAHARYLRDRFTFLDLQNN